MPRSCDVRNNSAPNRLMTAKATVRGVGLAALRWLRRLPPVRGDAVGAAVFLVLAMTGLAWVDLHPAGPPRGDEYDEVPAGSGIIARSEVIHLWLPESIWELASPQSQIVRDQHDLRRYLEHRNRQDLRYAVTIRGHQANGDYFDLHFIRNPCEYPDHFHELLKILADVSGPPGRETVVNFPGASAHVLSEERLDGEPSEIIATLQRVTEGEHSARTKVRRLLDKPFP